MCPGTKAIIEEEDKGWGEDPYMFPVEKMEKVFGLKFDGNDFIDEHVKWVFTQTQS